MSEKMECPGCNSYTSSVLSAVMNGDPCPYCGLQPEIITEVNAVRDARGDEALKARLQAAILAEGRAAAAEVEMRVLALELISTAKRAQRWLDAHPEG